MGEISGSVTGLALKPAHYAPLNEVDEMAITLDGIEGNAFATSVRRVTLLFREQWEEVQRELGAPLPWPLRRANVLVSGLRPQQLLKRRVRLGEVELRIHGETKPCGRMDDAHPGLKRALKSDCRGGVYASVLRGGRVRKGDTVTVLEESNPGSE